MNPVATRRGAALLIVLIAVVAVLAAVALGFRLASGTLQAARAALRSAQAREAAALGIAAAVGGGPLAVTLPGGAGWIVVIDSAGTGERIFYGVGTARGGTTAHLAAVLVPADSARGLPAPWLLRPWVELRW